MIQQRRRALGSLGGRVFVADEFWPEHEIAAERRVSRAALVPAVERLRVDRARVSASLKRDSMAGTSICRKSPVVLAWRAGCRVLPLRCGMVVPDQGTKEAILERKRKLLEGAQAKVRLKQRKLFDGAWAKRDFEKSTCLKACKQNNAESVRSVYVHKKSAYRNGARRRLCVCLRG